MALQFSTDGRYFAQVSSDGKLKIWDTSTSTFEQEFIPDYHLTTPCTCLNFIQPQSQQQNHVSPRKKKRKDSLDTSPPSIALGTNSGMLLIYSIAKGNVDYTLNSNTSQAITCISWNQTNSNCVYTGANQEVMCWNLDKKAIKSKWKAGNEMITAILTVSNNRLVTASKNIKLWDVTTKQILKTFTGHSFDTVFLNYVSSSDNTMGYVISGSTGDRLLSAWNLDLTNADKNSVANFLMEDIPVQVSIFEQRKRTNMTVVTRSGVAHVYEHTLNGKCTKPIKPKTTVQIVTNAEGSNAIVKPISVIAALSSSDLSLLIAYGSSTSLKFENMVLNNYEKVQCLIRQDPGARQAAVEDKGAVKITKPLTDGAVSYITPHTISATSVKRKAGGTTEVPMEQRLENLSLNKSGQKGAVPRADNVAQLLVQGLNSKDKVILHSVLTQKNDRIIRNTIRRLPMAVIVPLAKELTKLMSQKTQMCHVSSVWLRHLIEIHSSLLLSNPELTDLFAPVVGTIEHRLSLLTPLMKLQGRLNLLITQIGASKQEDQEADAEGTALFVYDDKDSSDASETEDLELFPHSDSDHEWSEDSGAEDGENATDDVVEANNGEESDMEM